MLDFTDKIVLVTGATRGIGLGIAQGFLQAGATVHISGTRENTGTYEDDLSAFSYHQADLSNEQGRIKLHQEIPTIDVLVNNAAVTYTDGSEYELDTYRKVIEMNLIGVMELCTFYREVLASRGGSIVNVGSLASHLSLKDVPAYTSSKSGVYGLTRVLADKWSRYGLRVNMIAPGFVKTRMTDHNRVDPVKEKQLLAMVPLRRWATPSEVAGAVIFLASPLASYITGVSLPIDGGVMLR
jgi:3-oxoacyl-[acyl-carrier protein] reductase